MFFLFLTTVYLLLHPPVYIKKENLMFWICQKQNFFKSHRQIQQCIVFSLHFLRGIRFYAILLVLTIMFHITTFFVVCLKIFPMLFWESGVLKLVFLRFCSHLLDDILLKIAKRIWNAYRNKVNSKSIDQIRKELRLIRFCMF